VTRNLRRTPPLLWLLAGILAMPVPAAAQQQPAGVPQAEESAPAPVEEVPGEAPQGGSALPREAAAAEDAAIAANPARIRDLIATLEDPDRRDALIADLEALLAVQGEPQPPLAEDAVSRVLDEITTRTAILRQVATAVATTLDELPQLLVWLERQVMDPETRAIWLWVGARVVLVLGVGAGAYLLLALALRPWRLALGATEPLPLWLRLPKAVGRLILLLLPVLGFTIAAFAALTLVLPVLNVSVVFPTLRVAEIQDMPSRVVLPLIYAAILVRTGIALLRFLLAPKSPGLRLLPLNHDAAHYAMRWSRRILATSIYGYYGLEAGVVLGLPWAFHGLLLHLLFFAVTVMGMIVVVQVREPVASAIASLGAEGRSRALRRLPWATLGSLWHVLALLYVFSIYMVWALKIPGGFRVLIEATVGSLAVAFGGWLLWRLADQLFRREEGALEHEEEQPGRFAGLEQRTRRYLPVLGTLARALVVIAVILGLFEVWGLGTLAWLLSDEGNTVLGHLVTVGVIVLVTFALWELISVMIARSITETDAEGNLKLSNRTRTLLNIIRNVVLVFLSLIALFLILSELGLNIAPLLAGAGVIGLAIGFGSQKLVQDIITGLFVLLGDTIRVGDVVEVAGRAGVVEEMTMRTINLRDLGGNVHTIPYSSIDTVMKYTKDFSYALLDIGVAYRENVDEVIRVLREVGDEMNRDAYFRRATLEPLEILGVDAFTDSAVVIRMRFKTRPMRQWEVGREFRRRVKNRFDELGIEIPYPHRTVYFGADKEGRASPARIEMLGRAAEAAPAPEGPSPEEAPSPALAGSGRV